MPPLKRPSVISPTDLAEPLAHQGAGDAEHLAHARAADGAFAANHDHVAGHDLLRLDRLEAGLLAVEHLGRAGDACATFSPATFATAPSGARLPFRMTMCPVSYIGLSSGITTLRCGLA